MHRPHRGAASKIMADTWKILISDKFPQEGLAVLEQADGVILDYQPGLSAEQLQSAIADVDALILRGGTQMTEELFQAANRLKVVGRAGVGTENMDLEAANRKGVIIMHTPFGSTTTTAEHTIAMVLALARQIPAASQSTKNGQWQTERFVGIEVANKVIGVIGAGKIGRLVIERALALKMVPLVYDPYLANESIRLLGAQQVELDELLQRADFITLHTPYNSDTANLLNSETLARTKRGCRIVNCATGGLIDEPALAEAIRNGQVAGAAIDVFSKEPPSRDNPLLGLDEVICTPHLRTATLDAQINVTVQVARQVLDFLQRGIIVNAVNVPSISADLLGTLRPYIDLAERLGSFQAQLHARGLEEIRLEFAGTVANLPVEPLTMAALKGLLTPMVGPEVNYINAPYLARERRIRIIETRSQQSDGFSSLISLTTVDSDGVHKVEGALFGRRDFRIVRVDDFYVEATPCGHLLVLGNEDRPGIIGFLGQVLGDAGVNIAGMNLSRQAINGLAVSLINVDSPIPDPVLEKLRNHPHIRSARQIVL
ncbi:MAG: phosphoglycerate dehydrogenase [Desulfuromonadales bacterium]|nr:phosphoglycerate dehydrogenase [Desulfuromonadales bacterium]